MAFILILCCICEFLQSHPCSALRIAPKCQFSAWVHIMFTSSRVKLVSQTSSFTSWLPYISLLPFFGGCCFACSNQYMLSFPFLFYGLAFFVLGLAIMPPRLSVWGIEQRISPPLSTALHPLVIGFTSPWILQMTDGHQKFRLESFPSWLLSRWRASCNIELSGLCDRRQPAVKSGGAVVLGIACKKTFYQRIYLIHPRSVSYENRDAPCTTNVDRWCCHIHRPARLLSSSSWADSFILQHHSTQKNHFGRHYYTRREQSSTGMIFRHGANPKLLPRPSIQP